MHCILHSEASIHGDGSLRDIASTERCVVCGVENTVAGTVGNTVEGIVNL